MKVPHVYKGDMLTETQEKLLQKYTDGECNLLERLRIQRLRTSPSGRAYLASLTACSPQIRAGLELRGQEAGSQDVDLWSRIALRLEQEDRAALFLGKRKPVLAEKFSFFPKPVFLGAGALATACLALLMFVPGTRTGNLNPSGVPGVNLASTNTSRLDPPRFLNNDVPTSVEVDWMRSNGRVKMIQSPEGGSDIIWVRRPTHNLPVVQSRHPVVTPSFSSYEDLGPTEMFSK
jgi:hypothetical protein